MTIKTSVIPVISELAKFGDFDNSAISIAKYAANMLGLDAAQQKVSLSAMGLLKKQREAVLSRSQELSVLQKLTVAEAIEKLKLDEEQTGLFANVGANEQLTASMIRRLVVEGKLSEEQLGIISRLYAETAATEAQTAANIKQVGTWKLLSASAKEAFIAMATNPLTWVAVAAAGIYALYRYNESLRESVAKSVETYNNLKSEAESLDSELKSVRDRMKELEAIDAPTVTDQEELDRLKEYNEQLERELRIKTALQKQAAKDSEDKAKKWLDHQDFGKTYDEHGESTGTLNWNEQASHLMRVVGIYRKKLDDAKAAMDTASDDVTSSAFKTAQKQAKTAQQNIDSTLKELYQLYNNIKDNVIEAIGDEADTDWAKEILALWDNFEKDYADLLDGGATPTIKKTQEATDSAAESVSTYTAQLSSLSDVISGLKSSYDVLKTAQDEMNSNGLSTDTIEKLAKENENYLDYLYEENGVIKLNTAAWKENADAKMQSEMAEIQKEIDSLNERNKSLLESIAYFEQMKDTDSNIGMWDQEIAKAREEIEKNTDAVKENQDTMSLYSAIFSLIRSDSDEAFSSLTDHLTFITGQYAILTKAQEEFTKSGVLSASTLSSIADKFPEMKESISLYIAGLKTSQELLDELSVAYGTDFDNYENAVKAKLQTSEAFYNSLTDSQKQLISELSKSYGIDLDNFKTIEQKKLAFQAEIIKQLAKNYSKYAGASLKELQTQYDNAIWSGGLDRAEMQALENAISAIEKYNRTLNSIASGVGLTNLYDPEKIESSSGSSSSKEVEEYTAAIDQYREALERLRQVQEQRSGVERQINGSEDLKEQIVLQKQLIDVYQQEQDALHNLNNQRDATITSGVQSLRELGFAVKYNADTNDLWISNLEHLNELTADSKGEYDTLQEATNALRKDTEDLIGTLENLNEENREGSSTWWDLTDSIREAKVAIVNDLKEIVSQASEAVDTIQDVYNTLKSAADEYADNGGFLSLDTYQAIVDLGPQYMQYLSDENEFLVINEENIRKVIAAKTEQLALENAMSYVERLKLALQEDSIEDLNELLYATTTATNATWGLVYANLALLDLDTDQYQAALHNINSLRSLADAAIDGIGRTTGEAANAAKEAAEAAKKELEDLLDQLEKMQDAGNDIIKYVMDMLKHRIQQQIDLLEEMKDKYSEIIDLKKESLRASKDEEDYQKKIKSKLKDMAKLQAQIDALGLAADQGDRKAAAERAKLLENLAELQDDLNDTQAEKAIETAEDALDKMEEAYHREKDKEIEILEDTVSSYQKLYDMAINYISDHWDTLYSELIDWNTEYGGVLNSEITEAWANCQTAAQRYGDFVTAMLGGIKNEIAAINAEIESLSLSSNSTSYGTTGSGVSNSDNTIVGQKKNYEDDYEDDYRSGYIAKISDLVAQMRLNSKKWFSVSDEDTRERMHQDSVNLAAQIARLGVKADYNDKTGEWIITSDKWNPSFIGEKLLESYHTGGVVGGGTSKENEQIALLKKKEWVLNDEMVDNVSRMIRLMEMFNGKYAEIPSIATQPILPDLSSLGGSTINNIVNKNSNQPVEIHFGDTIINGASQDAIDRHRQVDRAMVNEIARVLRIKM